MGCQVQFSPTLNKHIILKGSVVLEAIRIIQNLPGHLQTPQKLLRVPCFTHIRDPGIQNCNVLEVVICQQMKHEDFYCRLLMVRVPNYWCFRYEKPVNLSPNR